MPDPKAKPSADEAPEMFHGIRYGRPSDSKFSGRIFLVMIAIALAITLLLSHFFPGRRPPPPPKPAAPTGPVNVLIVPARPAPDQRSKASSTKTAKKSQPSPATTE